jgi:hypothetical protein
MKELSALDCVQRSMKILLACLLLPWASVQDGTTLAERLRDLGSELPQVRERAERDLVALGEAALPALRKASDDPDPERKERVRNIVARIEWNLLLQSRSVLQDLTDDERKFLEGVGHMTLSNPITLLRCLESHDPTGVERLKAEAALPKQELWSFIDPSRFKDAKIKGDHQVAPTQGNSSRHADRWIFATKDLSLTIQTDYEHIMRGHSGIHAHRHLPHGLLEFRSPLAFSRESLTWDADAGMLPCLKDVMLPGKKNVSPQRTQIFEKDGKISGAYFQFVWDRTGSMTTLRHVFVKERWALLVVFTW